MKHVFASPGKIILTFLSLLICVSAHTSTLEAEFKNPPHSAKPLTWFHAMSGNMSKPGLTKDLESIADVGIGGTILFNVSQGIPLGGVTFNSDRHIDMIGHMAKESKRLGLSFGIHNCDGWTSSGGPWITPEHSMKKVVWSESIVSGEEVNISLKQPVALHNYYEEIAVIAYPSLPSEIQDKNQKPKITASSDQFDPSIATDTLYEKYTKVTAKEGEQPWIQFSYEQPYTLRLIEMLVHEGRGIKFTLHSSDDGINFTKQTTLPLRRPGKRVWGLDANVDSLTSKHFRIYANKPMNVLEVKLSSTPAINNYLGRTSIARTSYNKLNAIGEAPKNLTINAEQVLDITSKMNKKGELRVTLPKGNWTIMRFGYTTTGAVNIPASKEGTGLEVDKFNREAFDVHYGAYVTNVLNKVKAVAPGAIQSIEIDSYEVGGQNWTHQYEKLFKEKFGYELTPYLPLYAGKFVESPTVSEKVLWDTRELYNQLISENYYGYFTELANKDGVKTYIEPYGFGPFNDVDAGSKADIPMGEFWLKRNVFRMSAASSAAHIYNKNIVSAEAFTAKPEFNWLFHPFMGKADGDRAFTLGVNQMVFHRFAHQANTHVKPGMTMNRWGVHFDRTQTWWDSAGKDWFKYMARAQSVLREGVPIADILWYLGDASPTSCPEKHDITKFLPPRINYDCLNSEVLINKLKAKKGKLVLPHGSSYKALYLTNNKSLSLASLTKIYELAKKGVVIIGDKTLNLASKNVSQKDEARFEKMVDYIWSRKTTYTTPHWDKIFKDNNFNYDLAVKDDENVYYSHRKSKNADIYFMYNQSDKEKWFDTTFDVSGKIPELWFPLTGETKKLAIFAEDEKGQTRAPFKLKAAESAFIVFRESSKNIEPLALSNTQFDDIDFKMSASNRPVVSARKETRAAIALNEESNRIIYFSDIPSEKTIQSPWSVSFNKEFGLDKKYTFNTLIDWKDHPEKEIRSYSGTAQYSNVVKVPNDFFSSDQKIVIQLGQVNIAAKVKINNQYVGTVWMPPYELDATAYLKPGENTIEIEVANLWVNRLIADEAFEDTSGYKPATWNNPTNIMPKWYTDNQPPPKTERFTFTTQPFFTQKDPLSPSGLIGPVTLYVVKSIEI